MSHAPFVPHEQQMLDRLQMLYDPAVAQDTLARLRQRIERSIAQYGAPIRSDGRRLASLTAADAMLITYGDQIREPDRPPLQSLREWLHTYIGDVLTSVHILPFYPYSSDDGFSVIDYRAVDPALGDWPDVERLSRDFKPMFDAVINHISAQSSWFQGFLAGDPRYADYFIVVDDPNVDVSSVTRPRTHPLLTTFETATGPHKVWTTFSTDQIDLNFANPDVLLEIIDVLLLYVERGAHYLRLDAIGYLWKELGTRSIHLPQTHAAVQVIRSVLDIVAPHVLLITETNVPHIDNISYFGDGQNEAQLVYQFPLAPLTLNAFHTGSTRYLQAWASTLAPPSDDTTFFNFLASHDGIGVMPARGILSDAEIDALVQITERHGGRVSYKTNSDGSVSPYELNITLFDALSDPISTPEDEAEDRFMVAQAIMLALQGLPGIYIHSLIGSSNYHAGVAETGHNRSINREKWQRATLEAALADPSSRSRRLLDRYHSLIRQRASSDAFDPTSPQRILPSDEGLFVLFRSTIHGNEHVICLHNVTTVPQRFSLALSDLIDQVPDTLHDLLSDSRIALDGHGTIEVDVSPLSAAWLRVG